jgi:hypothetical protein
MSQFAATKIESVNHPTDALPPEEDAWLPEEYGSLLERVAEEARKQSAHARAWELARQQGVKPIQNMEELKGNFWPEEESIDEFLLWLRELRQSDRPRSIPE